MYVASKIFVWSFVHYFSHQEGILFQNFCSGAYVFFNNVYWLNNILLMFFFHQGHILTQNVFLVRCFFYIESTSLQLNRSSENIWGKIFLPAILSFAMSWKVMREDIFHDRIYKYSSILEYYLISLMKIRSGQKWT